MARQSDFLGVLNTTLDRCKANEETLQEQIKNVVYKTKAKEKSIGLSCTGCHFTRELTNIVRRKYLKLQEILTEFFKTQFVYWKTYNFKMNFIEFI